MNQNLSKQSMSLWAKKRTDDGWRYWLPLVVHLTDTQNIINWLFNHWLCDGQRRIIMGVLPEEEVQKLVKFVGFFHDSGKATPVFQSQPSYDGDTSLDKQLELRLLRNGFIDFNTCDLSSKKYSPHARAGEAISEGFGVPISIGAIIGGHHGKPESRPPYKQIEHYPENYYQSGKQSEVQQPWRQVQKELFNYGLVSSGYQTVSEIPDIEQPQAILLEGLLIMADWLASSEYLTQDHDISLFPLIRIDQSGLDVDITVRFKHAVQCWNIDDEWVPQKINPMNAYQERWHFNPRPVQKIMTQAIDETTDPGMVIVEAPMGLGKTEISLIAVEQLAYKTGRDGVFFGLPTQATTNAMFDRVETWMQFLAQTQNAKFATKLMHSKAQFNENYLDLPHAVDVAIAEDESSAVMVNDWFSGKKSILTKFTVGTIDNLLLMGLKQKHLFLRHLGFSGKVVVVDEVHAYDVYMDSYLYKAIRWLGAYHVPIILLSATLPKDKRNLLLQAYLKGKYGIHYNRDLQAPDGWKNTTAYPLLSIVDGNEIKQVKDFPGVSDQKPLKLQVQRLNEPDETLMANIVAQISGGGIAGLIVNTVKRAQVLAQLVPRDIPLMVLHSAFLATDRSAQETALQDAIGKHGTRPEKMIVIGTQVLEQSLDIDFDVLYTDIAPMDLVLQRAGRLHRHHIQRPAALQQPKLFVMGVMGPNEYEAGSTKVYGQYLLMKTDHFLKDTITLPDDISPLVQAVYDPITDKEVSEINEPKDMLKVKLDKKTEKAENFQICPPSWQDNKTIHGWLDRSLGNIDRYEQRAIAAVRDIKETLEVILIQHTESESFLLDGRNLTTVTPREIAQQVIRIPTVITPGPEQINDAIKALEDLTGRYFTDWQSNDWLKGALALPLDQHFSTDFKGWRLTYSSKLGLSYEKEGNHGEPAL